MSSPSGVQLVPHGKNVLVYRNGDPFHNGRRMVVNVRQFVTFEAFLNEVTSSIQAPTAVRSIYTPRNGHRVTQLSDLMNRGQYVAAGTEKFRKLDYLHTEVKPPATNKAKDIQQVSSKNVFFLCRWREESHLPCIIHVFRNGDLLTPPIRVLIPPSILKEWELVLTLLTEKANLYRGAVRRICTLDGVSISFGAELVSGEYYVAVGSERFKCLPYEELLTPPGGNNRVGVKRRIPKVVTVKNYSVSHDGVSDSGLNGAQGDGRRVHSTGTVPNSSSIKYPKKEEESVFYAKPVRVRPTKKDRHNNNETGDEGGVFKVKEVRRELYGAQEVKEDSYTHVEVPVDQREAEIVQEENVSQKKGGHR
ncbi:PREDICTED: doublecortin domain-containing protein 2B [Nanorana parkeri]|uniref:doublecortin domain-containing protein 2B n=1 Tax=Nanorana parkeri TaxID=125878 RepID=UPI000854E022|nr:PREDICTED: doublecortin domain-containing protein 2B [Nanorana parkeri]